jgi:hypothetical protein
MAKVESKKYQLFGDQLGTVLDELSKGLVA